MTFGTSTISALFLLSSLTAAASNPWIWKEESPADEPSARWTQVRIEFDTLYVDGPISSMVYDVLQSKEGQAVRKISLNSYGGDVDIAYLVAEKIRERGISTELRAKAFCASACPLLFQAGAERYAHRSARLGYHGVRIGSMPTVMRIRECHAKPGKLTADCRRFEAEWLAICDQETKRFFGALEDYGTSQGLFRNYRALPIDMDWAQNGNCYKISNWVLSAEEAVRYGVVQAILN
jgi:hypothetical protein